MPAQKDLKPEERTNRVFSIRLSNDARKRPEEARAREVWERWLAEAEVSGEERAASTMFAGLILRHVGETVEPPSVPYTSVKNLLSGELEGLLRELLLRLRETNPGALQRFANAAPGEEEGEEVGEDLFAELKKHVNAGR